MRQQMALGPFVFSLGRGFPYSRLERKSHGGWIEIDLAYASPSSQNTGQDLGEIRLTGTAYYAQGMERLAELRALQAERRPLAMVDALGMNLGRWRLDNVEETQRRVIDDGTAMAIDWVVQLREFFDAGNQNDRGGQS